MKSRWLCSMALAVSVAGCVAEVDTLSTEPTSDDIPPATSELALTNTRQTAFNYFVAKGLTKDQSAGIVGNLVQESSVSATAVEFGGGPGRGIAQWSVGGRWDSSHNDNVTSFASAAGTSRWALNTQLDFIWFELTTISGYGLAQLRAATTLSAATVVFMQKYEVCGTCAQSRRIADAQAVLNDFGGSTTGGGGGSGSGSTGAQCYSGTLGMEMPQNACVESKFDGQWYQCSNGSWVDRYTDPDACSSVHPL